MKRYIINYKPELKELAKKLRKNSTFSEVLLWNKLKRKQMKGYDFHRQKPINNYIVDFFCEELMLAIEIDGETHFDQLKKDEIRQGNIEKLGISFLRFGDLQVKKNIAGVVMEIEDWICKHVRHTPSSR
jgi:very-short-patch-repair endonuclease